MQGTIHSILVMIRNQNAECHIGNLAISQQIAGGFDEIFRIALQ